MNSLAALPLLLAPLPTLAFSPEDCRSEAGLVGAIADQAGGLVSHKALYVYWSGNAGGTLRLETVRVERSLFLPGPLMTYAGLMGGAMLPPVPLTVDAAAGRPPRRWSASGEAWLDVPAGPHLLLRYLLKDRTARLRLDRLTRWAAAGAEAVAAALALPGPAASPGSAADDPSGEGER